VIQLSCKRHLFGFVAVVKAMRARLYARIEEAMLLRMHGHHWLPVMTRNHVALMRSVILTVISD